MIFEKKWRNKMICQNRNDKNINNLLSKLVFRYTKNMKNISCKVANWPIFSLIVNFNKL